MKEDLVSFEIAQLLKEKGFSHMEANCYGDNMCYQLPEGNLINALKGNTVTGYVLAPTLSLAQKWLREKYQILVEVWHNNHSVLPKSEGRYTVEVGEMFTDFLTVDKFVTYEEALSAGILEALKLIK